MTDLKYPTDATDLRNYPTEADRRNLHASMARRRANDPKWALYYAFYKLFNGRETDGFSLSLPAYEAATLAVKEIIPQFYVRKGNG